MTITPKITELWTSDSVTRLFDTSALGFYLVGIDGTLLDANATFCRIIGLPREAMVGRSLSRLLFPEDRVSAMRALVAVDAAAPATQVSEQRFTTNTGRPIWLKVRGSTVLDDAGHAIHRVCMVENITETKENELHLEQLAAIVEQCDDAIVRADAYGIVQYWSKGAERLYGYAAEEVLGRDVSFLVAGVENERTETAYDRLRRGEVITDWFGTARHKDGRLLPVSVLLFSLQDPVTASLAFVGVHRDLSELRQLEEQLRHSQRMETAGLLAGGIAHDFNNILTVIQGASSTLMDELAPGSLEARYLELVERSADKASRLTRQLLAFSRKQPITPEVFDPAQQLNDFAPMLVRTLGENIRLQTAFHSTRLVSEDPTQLEQVVLNLCINARYAMNDGGTLQITTTDHDAGDVPTRQETTDTTYMPLPLLPGRYVCIEVSDTGSGMPAAVLREIFEPFFTTKPKGEGTGLGLAVVYGIVAQSGGAIEVRSEVGKGSCFRVFLPSVTAGSVETAAVASPGRSTRNGKLLLIEDDDDLRALLIEVLEDAGYDVTAASSPKVVLAEGLAVGVDLIVTDVVMPDMHGTEFAQLWLKSHPEARFLFISGYFDNERYPDQLSPQQLLLKPFKPVDLIARIEQQLGPSDSGEAV